jgi:mono/diheme cytochrome c family protein/glucose/arabinose dehydrogenase
MKKTRIILIVSLLSSLSFSGFKTNTIVKIDLAPNAHISLIGGNLGSRMMHYGLFETELHVRHPEKQLFIRNMCDPGDTPGFRPHASRFKPWAFPGAEKYQSEYANPSDSEGHFDSPDQWLANLKTDIIIAFFGYSESFKGLAGLQNFKNELTAFILHTKQQQYNGHSAPALAIVSPIAFEDLSSKFDLPNGQKENQNLRMYSQAMREVCAKNKVLFVDAFEPSKKWYSLTTDDLTIDGFQLNKLGYSKLAELLVNEIFGKTSPKAQQYSSQIRAAVNEKNWMWHQDYKIPNGVHVYGRRYNPFGPDNYPAEIEKIRELTAIRDRAIWAANKGQQLDLATEDKKTRSLPQVTTNYNPQNNGSLKYLYNNEATSSLKMAEGFKIELFASEQEFPDLAKPMQMSFDNQGRLWVACMPSYPHYKPGDAKPNDKLLILEDTNADGKADKQTVFADGLHLPLGFEFAPEGVYVSQGTNLKLLTDTNDDDHADKTEIILSGYDDHDTHHNSHAFCADPSGAIYSGEGVFLHTNIETPHGTVRATNGGFYRYSPQLKKLERTAQLAIPNPWGIAFDAWGQPFFAETSSPDVRWMLPGSIKNRYGQANPKSKQLIEKDHMVRPTSGLEFLWSRHFPDHMQGDLLINNTIGFLGMKQHKVEDNGTGYKTSHRQDLIVSTDRNFRPVDMEIAPDGSLYVIDWHNILIGHMQHNARDPLRDHSHGRVYRITYPSRPLVQPAQVAGASIETLLSNLTLPEYRSRYRSRRELRGRNSSLVLTKMQSWIAGLDKAAPNYEHHLLEALWVSWGLNKVDQKLLNQLLQATDYRVRAAAVMVLRYTGHQVKNQAALLMQAAKDPNTRVRLTALVAASWLPKVKATPILLAAKKQPMDDWMTDTYAAAWAHVNGQNANKTPVVYSTSKLKGKDHELYLEGKALYAKEGYCITCHQADGHGLAASGFPSLANTPFVNGSEERLIKIILKGLMGPLEVNGKKYDGQVPMTPFEGLLNDREVAAVATYIRNSFGNSASLISPEKVKTIRAANKAKKDFYQSDQLLNVHPIEKRLWN